MSQGLSEARYFEERVEIGSAGCSLVLPGACASSLQYASLVGHTAVLQQHQSGVYKTTE